jgi:hypothetical protein
MRNSRQVIHPRFEVPDNPTMRTTERPLKIRVVFDDDASARSAEILIKHVTAGLECDIWSFAFDDLALPGRGLAAARHASDADILIVTVRDDHALPAHIEAWLDLYVGLRDKDQEGVLVLLIANAEDKADPDSSLVDYLETIAAIGGLSFIPGRGSVVHHCRKHEYELA